MDILTTEQLAFFDGKDGRPAYIAYKGDIYDVTDSHLWKSGNHAGKHQAGTDLTGMLSKAPHNEDKLSIFPVVARLAQRSLPTEIEPDNRPTLKKYYDKYHPHPVAVHFPMGLTPFAMLMQLIYIYTDNFLFFYAGYFAIVTSLVGSAGSVASGILSWKVNYSSELLAVFKAKIILSAALILFLSATAINGMKYLDGLKGIATLGDGTVIYTLLVIVCTFLVIATGYIGGRITWPRS